MIWTGYQIRSNVTMLLSLKTHRDVGLRGRLKQRLDWGCLWIMRHTEIPLVYSQQQNHGQAAISYPFCSVIPAAPANQIRLHC